MPQQPWQMLTCDDVARYDLKIVQGHSARSVIALPHLLRGETLDRLLLQVYGPTLMPENLPVLVSQWFKFYAMQLIPPVIVASLARDMTWPLQLDQLGFALHERGVLDGVRFEGAACAASSSDDPFERFAALLENLQSVIEHLSLYGEVAPTVLWGSAGDYLETCLRQLTEVDHQRLEIGYGLLRQRLQPDGRRNPLYRAITYIEGPDGLLIRRRRTCCLSYQVEWVGRCEHCPLQGSPLNITDL
ncbi:siderophore-iron reductase FhuF [Pseudomonas sp. LP_7_YM]|uniref:siderophore-iron reductase FhuF n=1 Tax=Pseudomonas sp. LP_7_YM TaxID=2485137 RepID=UPI0010E76689|nr:siderophore-iron reductase FhuF [Pseudomonas sp. LP_7_YM]TDV70316.1 ferric iron reductase protein FhuF [Pseudomonas sp. LP_7_YM]